MNYEAQIPILGKVEFLKLVLDGKNLFCKILDTHFFTRTSTGMKMNGKLDAHSVTVV